MALRLPRRVWKARPPKSARLQGELPPHPNELRARFRGGVGGSRGRPEGRDVALVPGLPFLHPGAPPELAQQHASCNAHQRLDGREGGVGRWVGRRRGLRGPATRVAPRVAPAVHWDSAHGGACGNAPPCLLPPCPLLRSVGAQIVPCNADAGARLGSCKPSALARDDGRLAMGLGVLPGGWVFMWLCTPPTRPRPTRCAVRVAGPVEASQRAPSPVATDSSRRGTPTRGAPRALQPVAPHDKAAPHGGVCLISRRLGGQSILGGAGGRGETETRKREGPGRAQGAKGRSRGAAVSSVVGRSGDCETW